MVCRIEYKSSVAHDLKKLDRSAAERIIGDLEEVLSQNPDAGEALLGQFKGLFKLRVGNYRVVYSKVQEGVLIVRISHRSKVYR